MASAPGDNSQLIELCGGILDGERIALDHSRTVMLGGWLDLPYYSDQFGFGQLRYLRDGYTKDGVRLRYVESVIEKIKE